MNTTLPEYHLHFCLDLREHQVDEVIDLVPGMKVFYEGDGWYAWGEPLGTAGNNDHDAHVIVANNDLGDLREVVKMLHLRSIHAVMRPWWALTTAADWSQVIDCND
jgi:hypothetical protein